MGSSSSWVKRAKDEYRYYTSRPWSLKEVGDFWDSVEDYDDINDKMYPYFKRFTNSEELLRSSVSLDYDKPYRVLDVQTRSGRGTKFWREKLPNASFVCVDFSDGLLRKAQNRLDGCENVEFVKTLDPLLNLGEEFDVVLCYETVEHIYEYDIFINSLSKHLSDNGVMILTCPNVSWEIIHWITAITGFNHSEGPHRFIKYRKLLKTFKNSNLVVKGYNTTIFLPFNNKKSIFFDKLLSKILPAWLKRLIMLRHSFILTRS